MNIYNPDYRYQSQFHPKNLFVSLGIGVCIGVSFFGIILTIGGI